MKVFKHLFINGMSRGLSQKTDITNVHSSIDSDPLAINTQVDIDVVTIVDVLLHRNSKTISDQLLRALCFVF